MQDAFFMMMPGVHLLHQEHQFTSAIMLLQLLCQGPCIFICSPRKTHACAIVFLEAPYDMRAAINLGLTMTSARPVPLACLACNRQTHWS